MTHGQVKVGKEYIHRWNGHDWRIRVERVGKEREGSRPDAWVWHGMITEAIGHSRVGDLCWGYVSELREPSDSVTSERKQAL